MFQIYLELYYIKKANVKISQYLRILINLSEANISLFSRATVKLHYDSALAKRFGSDAENMARRVMAHAQNAFLWKSLTTKVIFEVHPEVRSIEEECHPDKSL